MLVALMLATGLKILGAVIALAALGYTAYSVGMSRRVSRAQFWLDLRDRFAKHDHVHRRLRPGGEWDVRSGMGPSNAADGADVEAYMGLLEHCEILLRQRLIDTQTFKDIYEYRVSNIIRNEKICVEKLVNHGEHWCNFLALVERLGLNLPYSAA